MLRLKSLQAISCYKLNATRKKPILTDKETTTGIVKWIKCFWRMLNIDYHFGLLRHEYFKMKIKIIGEAAFWKKKIDFCIVLLGKENKIKDGEYRLIIFFLCAFLFIKIKMTIIFRDL